RARVMAGIAGPELAEAVRSMPVAFRLHEGKATVVALMGLGEENLFVGPKGEWLGGYIPAVLRAWPFALVKQGEQQAVAVDADSEAISETEGQPLFGEDGEPTESLQKVIKFLQSVSKQEAVMARAVAALQAANLLVPWEFTARKADGKAVKVTGLYQVDRQAFEGLNDEDFLKLRSEGALPLIYGHVFSQRNVSALEKLAQRQPGAPIAPE